MKNFYFSLCSRLSTVDCRPTQTPMRAFCLSIHTSVEPCSNIGIKNLLVEVNRLLQFSESIPPTALFVGLIVRFQSIGPCAVKVFRPAVRRSENVQSCIVVGAESTDQSSSLISKLAKTFRKMSHYYDSEELAFHKRLLQAATHPLNAQLLRLNSRSIYRKFNTVQLIQRCTAPFCIPNGLHVFHCQENVRTN